MAAPTAPTLASITTAALNSCGESNPSSALLARAALWMEEIKNDIWTKTKALKSLQTVSALVITQGLSRYSMPSDYAGAGDISMSLLDGNSTGAVQSGAAATVTLASTEAATSEYVRGKEILITSGTAVNKIAQAYSYNSTTKIATVSPAWATVPVSGDGYMIVERYWPLEQGGILAFDHLPLPNMPNRPTTYHPVGDNDYSEFYLSECPDKTYGVRVRYPINLMTVDLESTLISTLYQKYRNVWIDGVMARHYENENDNREVLKKKEYGARLTLMVGAESYGNTLTMLQQRCVD